MVDSDLKDRLISVLRQDVRSAQEYANSSQDLARKAESFSRQATRIDPEHHAAMTNMRMCMINSSNLNNEMERIRSKMIGMMEMTVIQHLEDKDERMQIIGIIADSLQEVSRLTIAVNQFTTVITRIYKDGIERILYKPN